MVLERWVFIKGKNGEMCLVRILGVRNWRSWIVVNRILVFLFVNIVVILFNMFERCALIINGYWDKRFLSLRRVFCLILVL